MKIIEATWEYRNFGRKAFEILLDKRDFCSMDSVLSHFSNPKFLGSYVTVKLPVGDLNALHLLEDNGFRFMETQLSVQYDLSKYKTPPELKKLLYPIAIREIPHDISAWKEISDRITPDLFETDRISLDPLFGPEIGCFRYRNWILDLVNITDSHLLIFYDPSDDNLEYGFTIDRFDEKTKIINGILAGVFTDCDKPGMGFSIYDASFRNDIKRGAKILKSAISSNNPPVMAVDSALGVPICKPIYVLRKQFVL